MKNLSQIPESELIIVKYKEGMTEVIEAGEIASCIAYNEGYNLEFFTAEEKETKAFVEAFNKAADERATYRMGEAIDLES